MAARARVTCSMPLVPQSHKISRSVCDPKITGPIKPSRASSSSGAAAIRRASRSRWVAVYLTRDTRPPIGSDNGDGRNPFTDRPGSWCVIIHSIFPFICLFSVLLRPLYQG